MSRWKQEPHCMSILSYIFLYIMICNNFIIFANLKNHKHTEGHRPKTKSMFCVLRIWPPGVSKEQLTLLL